MKRSPHRFQRSFSLAECMRLEAAMEVEKKGGGEKEDVCSRLSAIEVAKELESLLACTCTDEVPGLSWVLGFGQLWALGLRLLQMSAIYIYSVTA
ncbi:hypothetical protein KQX54_017961 [Cotesia glomerata]|uniref:Uncharacterized protein n=1 Tax=Cotesia glomerata TaxID=32391 RepID=A0AAV7J8R8_COTGL|nr:hypothetical protein KQX54_017961 [Cotesia glomerata]